jgi:hypothetical protein
LRWFAGACTIELAYQAAEANHPDQGRDGSPLTKDSLQTGPAHHSGSREESIGQASPQETLAESYQSRQPESAVAGKSVKKA